MLSEGFQHGPVLPMAVYDLAELYRTLGNNNAELEALNILATVSVTHSLAVFLKHIKWLQARL